MSLYRVPGTGDTLLRERTASGAVIQWATDSYKVRVLRMVETVHQDGSVVKILDGIVLGLEATGIYAIGHGVQVPGRCWARAGLSSMERPSGSGGAVLPARGVGLVDSERLADVCWAPEDALTEFVAPMPQEHADPAA